MIIRITLIIAVFCVITKTTFGDVNGNQFIGGTSIPATAGEFPSFVHLQLQNSQCAGFIVNINHIVTAGSCILDSNHSLIAASTIQARFNMTTLPATPINVDRIYVHPLFNPFTFDNDIAVIRTVGNIPIQVGPTPNIFPAVLNDRIVQDHLACTFVGMTQLNPALHSIVQPLLNRTCNNLFNNRMVPSQFCAGTNAPAGPCPLNLGGPLFCNGRVTGILSNSFSCNVHADMPGVYTQIRRYIPWIMQQFNRTDLTPAGPTPAPTFPLLGGQSTIVGYTGLIMISVLGLILAG